MGAIFHFVRCLCGSTKCLPYISWWIWLQMNNWLKKSYDIKTRQKTHTCPQRNEVCSSFCDNFSVDFDILKQMWHWRERTHFSTNSINFCSVICFGMGNGLHQMNILLHAVLEHQWQKCRWLKCKQKYTRPTTRANEREKERPGEQEKERVRERKSERERPREEEREREKNIEI